MSPTTRRLLTMAMPLMTSRFVQTLNTFISMLVLAQLGHRVLAASLLISSTRVIILLVFLAPLFAIGSITGRQFGGQHHNKLAALIWQAWLTALLLSGMAILSLNSLEPLLRLFHQPEDIIPVVMTFMHYFLPSIPIIALAVTNMQFLAGIKKQGWITWISLITLVVNAVLSYGLTLGYFGLPHWGVKGCSLAMLTTNTLGALLSFIAVIRYTPKLFHGKTQSHRKLVWLRQIFKIGLPICGQLGSEMIAMSVLIIMVGWFGELAMGANHISREYMLFVIVPIFGLADASGVTIGHAMGERHYTAVRQIGHSTIRITLVFCTLITAIFALGHKPLADAFIHLDSPNAMALYGLAMTLLTIRIISMYFDSIADVLVGALRGLYDTRYPMWVEIVTNWGISVPLAFTLSQALDMGMVGIPIAAIFGRFAAMVSLVKRWQRMSLNCAHHHPKC